jgi:class 3 adenylate cyclase
LATSENEGDAQEILIDCHANGFQVSRQPRDGQQTLIRLRNPNSFFTVLCLENTEWSEEILTAARITNWQPFRELLSTEVISPTESVTIGSQVVLFTDLRGSTAMYRGLGDAPAYAVVRNHFAILQAAVRIHHGTIVKTIGDAVMAAFSRVDEALAAVRQMHQDLPTANPELKPGLALKSSLHVGPCLAVNANDRLDYFGTTVNLAARMVECCKGGDLTVSDELFHRPEMASFVSACAEPPEPSEVQFRGFDSPHRVWRIAMVGPYPLLPQALASGRSL